MGIQLREGDIDETFNKKVHTLIIQSEECFVYLDEELYVEWHYELPKIPDKKGWGGVLNRVSLLESIPMRQLSLENQIAFKRMVGEALTRLLTEGDVVAANEILDKAEAFINARNSEVARRWQLSAAAVICAIAVLVGAVLWTKRAWGISIFGAFGFNAVMGASAGAVGATTSLLLRIRQMSFDASAGREAHIFDGATRILAGMAGAFVFALAVRVNLVAGIVDSMPHPFAAIILVCVTAGASERLVPDLITRLEGTFHREPEPVTGQATTQKAKEETASG